MGWQGQWRGAKGEHFFQDLPLAIRVGYKFIAAYSWRSNRHVWIKALLPCPFGPDEIVTMRFNRLTCLPEPLKGAENFLRMDTDNFLRQRLIQVQADLKRERERCEQLDVQLAGCLTAAEGATGPRCTAKPEDWGWSPAYQAVLDLRRNWDALTHEVEEAWKILNKNPAHPERWRSLAEACKELAERAEAAEQVFDVRVTVLPRGTQPPNKTEDYFHECTPGELELLNKGMCPDCQSANFFKGPEGGECTNVMCGYVNCGSRFNIRLPYFAQRISRPKPNLGL